MDLTGETLGQFRIIEPIGQGGMASVFRAYQPSLDRYVAIKVLPAQHALTPGFSERFVREARAIAQLNHPNILPVIDFGQEGDLSYIVMKYVTAGTLKDKMGRPLDLADASNLIDGIAAALDHAHARGILHRDVKPSNVLMDEGGWVLLADFGLAKMVAGDEGLTGSGVGIGTPAYMSPEQGKGVAVDARTDIYALGVVLYEMVTGRLPFRAETPFAIVMMHITEPLPLPRSLRPDLPEAVERVILKALAKDPEDRFRSAGDLSGALRSAIEAAPHAEATPPGETLAETFADLPGLYTRALGYFYTEQWTKAIENLETVVAAKPDYEDGDAAQRLAHAREKLRLSNLYSQARAAIKNEDWGSAIQLLNEIVTSEPGFRDAQTLLNQAQQREELADLYADARRLHDSGQWQAVINVWTHIRALDDEYPDPDGLLAAAQSELEKARSAQEIERQAKERADYLAGLYRRGLDHITAGEWRQAATLFEDIESLEPGYQEASALLERARSEIGLREPALVVEERGGQTLVDLVRHAPWTQYWPFAAVGLAGAILLVVIVVVLATRDTSPAAQAPSVAIATATKDMVFVSDRDGKREIYRVDASGEAMRWTFTPRDAESWSPVLAPGGSLFFVSDRDGKREIYRMEKSGEVARWTSTSGGSESWSPVIGLDGAVLFTSDRDGKREIYRMDISGEVARWTSSPGSSESWSVSVSSEGALFFTSDRDGKREIYRMEKSGEVARWTYSPGGSGSWDPQVGPNGVLFFTSDRDGKREIYRMEKSGEVFRWTSSPGDSESWAPVAGTDGALLFTSDRDGKREIYRMSRGGDVERVTNTPGGESWLSQSD